jgi:hypothetical protein
MNPQLMTKTFINYKPDKCDPLNCVTTTAVKRYGEKRGQLRQFVEAYKLDNGWHDIDTNIFRSERAALSGTYIAANPFTIRPSFAGKSITQFPHAHAQMSTEGATSK